LFQKFTKGFRSSEDDDHPPPFLLHGDSFAGGSERDLTVASPILKDFSVSDDDDVVVISSKPSSAFGSRVSAGGLVKGYLCHVKSGLYVKPESERGFKGEGDAKPPSFALNPFISFFEPFSPLFPRLSSFAAASSAFPLWHLQVTSTPHSCTSDPYFLPSYHQL
jgi:hypothetical protein